MVCKPDSDACNPCVMNLIVMCLHGIQVKLARLHQLIASSFSTTTKSDTYIFEADLLTVRSWKSQCYDSILNQQCAFLSLCLPCCKWFASFFCITHAQSALAKVVDIDTW
ncbi:TPA: hypothetical protein ACH3X1_008347 [Trebouxia sp. C0004]